MTAPCVCSMGRGTGVRGQGARVSPRLLQPDSTGLARIVRNTERWSPGSLWGRGSSSHLQAGQWF